MRPNVIGYLLRFLIIFPRLVLFLLSLLADEAICHVSIDVGLEFEEENCADVGVDEWNAKLLDDADLSLTFLEQVFLKSSEISFELLFLVTYIIFALLRDSFDNLDRLPDFMKLTFEGASH